MKILHATHGSPWWLHALGAAALLLHVGAGFAGIVSGTTAVCFRKGGPLHRLAGEVFVVAMLTMAAVGAAMAVFLSEWTNVMGGTFTFYLIASGWATVRRKDGAAGAFEATAMLTAGAAALVGAWFAWRGAHAPDGLIDGQPWQPAVVFAAIAAPAPLPLLIFWLVRARTSRQFSLPAA